MNTGPMRAPGGGNLYGQRQAFHELETPGDHAHHLQFPVTIVVDKRSLDVKL